jgi:hypothetical protein
MTQSGKIKAFPDKVVTHRISAAVDAFLVYVEHFQNRTHHQKFARILKFL